MLKNQHLSCIFRLFALYNLKLAHVFILIFPIRTHPQRVVSIEEWIKHIEDSREENTRRVSEIEKNHQRIRLMHRYINQRLTASLLKRA